MQPFWHFISGDLKNKLLFWIYILDNIFVGKFPYSNRPYFSDSSLHVFLNHVHSIKFNLIWKNATRQNC